MSKKIISLVGMSGVGKTFFAIQQNPSHYFHYSVDYIIGQYLLKDKIIASLLEEISDGALVELIKRNKIALNANVKVRDLYLVSHFLGKIGSKELGGLDKKEFLYRQNLYASAERQASLYLKEISEKIFSFGYDFIINDLTGSVCEIIDFDNENDEILDFIKTTKIHYLQASPSRLQSVIEQACKEPKPLLYNEKFLDENLEEFLKIKNLKSENQMNPNEFCQYIFPKLIKNRVQKYEKIVNNY